jgi:hypothetical protein
MRKAALAGILVTGALVVAQVGVGMNDIMTLQDERDAAAANAAKLAQGLNEQCEAGMLEGVLCQQAALIADDPFAQIPELLGETRVPEPSPTPSATTPSIPRPSPGAIGSPGADGSDGVDGSDGLGGADGADGADGSDGLGGADGLDGADGGPGPDGATGEPGAPGPTGAPGPAGPPGAGTCPEGSVLTLRKIVSAGEPVEAWICVLVDLKLER